MNSPALQTPPQTELQGQNDRGWPLGRLATWAVLMVVAMGIVAGGTVWLKAQGPALPGPQMTVNNVSVSPAYVVINTPTVVTFTATILHPSVLPTGVNLLKVDQAGKTLGIIGVMRDTGVNGDVLAGDKTFTLQVSLTEVGGSAQFRVSAAFKGVLQRVLSPVLVVASWESLTAIDLGVTFDYPSEWSIRDPADEGSLVIANRVVDPNRIPGSLEGLCKIGFGLRQKPTNQDLQQWLNEANAGAPVVSSVPILLNSFQGIREVTDEITKVDTVYVLLSASEILTIQLLCGADQRDAGLGLFQQILSTLRRP